MAGRAGRLESDGGKGRVHGSEDKAIKVVRAVVV